jgi:hypothetical protein
MGLALMLAPLAAQAQSPAPKRKPDLGDAAQGVYSGDVISDSQGSSQSNVTLTVTRVGPNLVKVTSDYERLPVVTVPLTRAMGRILQARGDSVFLLDPTKAPTSLDVTFNGEVSWSGTKQ